MLENSWHKKEKPLFGLTGLGGGVGSNLVGGGGDKLYVEDVFSTDLYTGNNTSTVQTINNGIDIDGKSGMIWFKSRNGSPNQAGRILDKERGTRSSLIPSSDDDAGNLGADGLTYLSNGFSIGNESSIAAARDYAAWSFRRAPGFFDVVTWEGNGSNPRNIPHNLGSDPGCIIIKRTVGTDGKPWTVWHKSSGTTNGTQNFLKLNSGNGKFPDSGMFPSNPTDTQFTISNDFNADDGGHFVAYLFADGDDADAQVFGDDGDEAIVKCGSYTGDHTNDLLQIDCGFEPQYVLIKRTDGNGSWFTFDIQRGVSFGDWPDEVLYANTTDGTTLTNNGGYADGGIGFTSNGFVVTDAFSDLNADDGQGNQGEHVYIAIRRPMKPATEYTATQLFDPVTYTSDTSSPPTVSTSIERFWDGGMLWIKGDVGQSSAVIDNVGTGYRSKLRANDNDNRETSSPQLTFDNNGFTFSGAGDNANNSDGNMFASWSFKRAPKFFDIACFKTNATNNTITVPHNLGVEPKFMIVKNLTTDGDWQVYHVSEGNTKYGKLNADTEWVAHSGRWGNTTPTATHFTISTQFTERTDQWVAYLWADLSGVSDVGHYTGNGSTAVDINVDCGFSSAARFVLIKNSEDTNGPKWTLWDSARGYGSSVANQQYYANESGSFNDTEGIGSYSSGFKIPAAVDSNDMNSNLKKHIYLAIA